jgi:hypothetical protein
VSLSVADDSSLFSVTERTKILVAVATGARAPDVMPRWPPPSVEKPDSPSRDHCSLECCGASMERLQARVELMLSARPWDVCPRDSLAGAAPFATFTFSSAGTVTDTVWVRLADPACAVAERESIALPRSIGIQMERRRAIDRVPMTQ